MLVGIGLPKQNQEYKQSPEKNVVTNAPTEASEQHGAIVYANEHECQTSMVTLQLHQAPEAAIRLA